MQKQIQKLFEPKSVAIVGASEKKGKIGNILVKNAIQTSTGQELKIFPVNPKSKKIEGLKTYTSILDIDEEIDLTVIAVPAKFVNKVVEECARKEQSIKNIIVISAGFGEAGEQGLARKEKLEELIKKYKLNILGPNCLGIINATKNINLSFAKKEVPQGTIGLISQSGAFITSMVDIAEKDQFGFSLISSLGNKIDIDENKLLEYYAQDKNTKIIALYLENISNGIKFQKIIQKVAKSKPIIIIKAGITERTKQAIQSHTGAMAGESIVAKEAIKDAGGILVDNLEDFVVLIKLLNNFSKLQSKDLVIVTNAGGPGVIATDLIENSNLKLFEFKKNQQKKLQTNLPQESSVNNPIDLLGDAQDDRYRTTFEVLKNIKGIGGVLTLVTPQAQTPIKKIVESIIRANQVVNFPIFPIVIGGVASEEAEEICQQGKINNFKFPVTLIRTLSKINQKKIISQINNIIEVQKNTNNIAKQRNETLLSYEESEKISRKFKLNILPAEYPSNNIELQDSIDKLKLPLVMKVDSPNIIHKNEKNGVVVGLDDTAKIIKEFARFQNDFPGEKILVQHQVESGLEIILGLKRDESFGLVLVIGLGGITTEILDEKILFIGKVTETQIAEKLSKSKLIKILKKQKISEKSLIKQAKKLFDLGIANPDIKEVDINPMFFYANQKPVIVDFKILKKVHKIKST